MSKAKGGRTRRRIEKMFRGMGYLVACVEKGGSRFLKARDLFSDDEYSDSGFDSIAISGNEVIFIQCKTNTPAVQEFYKDFAEKYAGNVVKVAVATWVDRKGCRIQYYDENRDIEDTFIPIKRVNELIGN